VCFFKIFRYRLSIAQLKKDDRALLIVIDHSHRLKRRNLKFLLHNFSTEIRRVTVASVNGSLKRRRRWRRRTTTTEFIEQQKDEQKPKERNYFFNRLFAESVAVEALFA